MPTPRRALLPKVCIVCGQEWTPQTSRQARENQTCSPACARAASGASRLGTHQAKTSDPHGRMCEQCGVFQPWTQFALRDGTAPRRRRQSWCRSCVSAYNRAYKARYRDSLNTEHRRHTRTGEWRCSDATRQRTHLLRRYARADRQVERARQTVHLVGAYVRAYAASSVCTPPERPTLYLQARMVLAWLLRSHCWCEPDAIAVVLRTSQHTIGWYIATVRAAIRDQHSRGPGQIGAGQDEMKRLKGHAQECLRRAEGHAPGSLEPLAQPHEHEEHRAPTDLEVYWRKRAAQQERERRYG